MPQTAPIGVRIEVATKRALDRAARADFRSTASLINKILAEYVVAHGLHHEENEAPIYRRVRGRPKAMPDESAPHLDSLISQELARNMEYSLDEACVATTGKFLADHVPHFDKALERSLLLSGWVQVENVISGLRVWISQDRATALAL